MANVNEAQKFVLVTLAGAEPKAMAKQACAIPLAICLCGTLQDCRRRSRNLADVAEGKPSARHEE